MRTYILNEIFLRLHTLKQRKKVFCGHWRNLKHSLGAHCSANTFTVYGLALTFRMLTMNLCARKFSLKTYLCCLHFAPFSAINFLFSKSFQSRHHFNFIVIAIKTQSERSRIWHKQTQTTRWGFVYMAQTKHALSGGWMPGYGAAIWCSRDKGTVIETIYGRLKRIILMTY